MRTGPENYGHGEGAYLNTNEAQSKIQKIKNEVDRIQTMINDMETKASMHAPIKEGDALNSVIEREKANLAEKREELSTLILQAEKKGDEQYLIKKEPLQEFHIPSAEEEAAFNEDFSDTVGLDDRAIDTMEKRGGV